MTMFTPHAYVIRYSLFPMINFRVPLPTIASPNNDDYTLNSRFKRHRYSTEHAELYKSTIFRSLFKHDEVFKTLKVQRSSD